MTRHQPQTPEYRNRNFSHPLSEEPVIGGRIWLERFSVNEDDPDEGFLHTAHGSYRVHLGDDAVLRDSLAAATTYRVGDATCRGKLFLRYAEASVEQHRTVAVVLDGVRVQLGDWRQRFSGLIHVGIGGLLPTHQVGAFHCVMRENGFDWVALPDSMSPEDYWRLVSSEHLSGAISAGSHVVAMISRRHDRFILAADMTPRDFLMEWDSTERHLGIDIMASADWAEWLDEKVHEMRVLARTSA